jgi:hypothetical protein
MVDIIFLTLVNRQWSYLSTRGVGLAQMRNFLAAKIYSLVVESSLVYMNGANFFCSFNLLRVELRVFVKSYLEYRDGGR